MECDEVRPSNQTPATSSNAAEGREATAPPTPDASDSSMFSSKSVLITKLRCGDTRSVLSALEGPTPEQALHSTDTSGFNLLHWAALINIDDVLCCILEHEEGKRLLDSTLNERQQTPLMWACIGGSIATAKRLIESGAQVNARDHQGYTPLILAAQKGHVYLVLLLLTVKWLDINAKDKRGSTALQWSSFKCEYLTLRILDHFGADLTNADQFGLTALHRAVQKQALEIACFLVEQRHLDPKLETDEGKSLLVLLDEQEEPNRLLRRKLEYWISTPAATIGRRSWVRLFLEDWLIPILGFFVGALIIGHWFLSMRPGIMIEITRPHMGFIHLLSNMTTICMVLSQSVMIWLIISDPGVVPRRENGDSIYEDIQKRILSSEEVILQLSKGEEDEGDDEDVEAELALKRICTTCKTRRETRTKHCRYCDRCVYCFDHHCAWVNNCIGGGNHRIFVLWLIGLVISFTSNAICGIFFAYQGFESRGNVRFIRDIFRVLWKFPMTTYVVVLDVMMTSWIAVMLYQQLVNVTTNLTINEQLHMGRYTHFWEKMKLKTSRGVMVETRRLRNPFDAGATKNCVAFWMRGRRSPKAT